MELAILALILGPSCAVLVVGCLLAVTRSLHLPQRSSLRTRSRGPAV